MNSLPIGNNDTILEVLGNTSPNLHDTILHILDTLPRGRVLDVPSGEGKLSYLMHKKGFEVCAGDIDQNVFKIPNIPFMKIDLNRQFPIKDSSFDSVVCIEGIEHIENSFHLCRELARILKPHGDLILSTPNILSIDSRLRFLLMGQFSFFGGYYSDKKNFYTYHINPVGYPQLSVALGNAGFIIEKISTNRTSYKDRLLPVRIVLSCSAFVAKCVMHIHQRDPESLKVLFSDPIIKGENLIMHCIKKDA
jgi:SAM-dependent methyltransferase